MPTRKPSSKGARTIMDLERVVMAGKTAQRTDMREIRRELAEIRGLITPPETVNVVQHFSPGAVKALQEAFVTQTAVRYRLGDGIVGAAERQITKPVNVSFWARPCVGCDGGKNGKSCVRCNGTGWMEPPKPLPSLWTRFRARLFLSRPFAIPLSIVVGLSIAAWALYFTYPWTK